MRRSDKLRLGRSDFVTCVTSHSEVRDRHRPPPDFQMKQGSGAVVVGAKVTVTNPKTSLNRAKNTNAARTKSARLHYSNRNPKRKATCARQKAIVYSITATTSVPG